MYDREEITPEFYDKLSESEKREFVQCMLEEQLTDPSHIKGLPKPVQNSIKSAVKMSVKDMKKETIAGYPVEWINGIKSKDEDDYLLTGATKNFKPNQEFDRLQKIVDKPYPVMMPEDVKTMREMSDEFMGKLLRDLRENSPCRMIPISTISEISPPDQDEMIKSVKRLPIHTYDWAIAPSHRAERDRMGRIWLDSIPKLCEHVGISKEEYLTWLYDSARKHGYQPNTLYIRPRAFGHNYKSSLWMKLLGMYVQSYSIDEFPMLPEPITTVQLYDVIHWNHVHINYTFGLKARDFRYGKMWQDQELINYATGDVSHIDRMILDSLATFGPDINSGYGLSTPNLNDIDKKKLERVIKKRRKKK